MGRAKSLRVRPINASDANQIVRVPRGRGRFNSDLGARFGGGEAMSPRPFPRRLIHARRMTRSDVIVTKPGDLWILAADWTIDVRGVAITIPAGTETDFASIPRLLWPLRSNVELPLAASLLHDFLYRTGGRPALVFPPREFARKEADRIFYAMMREGGTNVFSASIAYRAVRLFGGRHWRA